MVLWPLRLPADRQAYNKNVKLRLNRKLLLKIAISAFLLTFVIRIIAVLSIGGIYDCVGRNLSAEQCTALKHADIKIQVGSILQFITWYTFLVSIVLWLWFVLRKKP